MPTFCAPGQRPIRFCSLGCAKGQEAYSIAMLVLEHWPDLKFEVIAIDRVEMAESFSPIEVASLSPQCLEKYFVRQSKGWLVCDQVRRRIDFRRGEIISCLPNLPEIDVVFLRNVLCYNSPSDQSSILRLIRDRINPCGWLFLFGTESLRHDSDWVLVRGHNWSDGAWRRRDAMPVQLLKIANADNRAE